MFILLLAAVAVAGPAIDLAARAAEARGREGRFVRLYARARDTQRKDPGRILDDTAKFFIRFLTYPSWDRDNPRELARARLAVLSISVSGLCVASFHIWLLGKQTVVAWSLFVGFLLLVLFSLWRGLKFIDLRFRLVSAMLLSAYLMGSVFQTILALPPNNVTSFSEGLSTIIFSCCIGIMFVNALFDLFSYRITLALLYRFARGRGTVPVAVAYGLLDLLLSVVIMIFGLAFAFIFANIAIDIANEDRFFAVLRRAISIDGYAGAFKQSLTGIRDLGTADQPPLTTIITVTFIISTTFSTLLWWSTLFLAFATRLGHRLVHGVTSRLFKGDASGFHPLRQALPGVVFSAIAVPVLALVKLAMHLAR
ncbi:MAG: hypothetical protein RLN60_02270 [Phycisphaerales bacterium]